jgi:hypothetical protein
MYLPILPFENMKKVSEFARKIDKNKSIGTAKGLDYSIYSSFDCAKDAIHYLCRMIGLNRDDEVYISTTSNSNFVSSCVTCTIFNYAKVSRVITSKTKLIFVIHEFGYFNESVFELKRIANEMGIFVVEDSAHAIPVSNERLDKYVGDFLIHSVTKSLPVSGGLLLSKQKNINSTVEDARRFNKYLMILSNLNNARRNIYSLYHDSFSRNFQILFEMKSFDIPFFFGFETHKAKQIQRELSGLVEFGINHIENNLLIPLNPMIDIQTHKEVIQEVEKYIKS